MDLIWSHIAVICKVLLHFVQMKNTVILTLLVLCVSALPCVHGNATGAGPTACTSMIPGHGSNPASGTAPYSFTVTKTNGAAVTEYSAGETLRITITPNAGQTFKGFLLKVVQQGQTDAVGAFDAASASVQTRCGNGLTHTGTSTWSEGTPLVVDWTAPSPAVGSLEFFATIVRVQVEYWVKVQPAGLTVLNQAAVNPGVTLTSTLDTITVSWQASAVYDTITIYNANSLVQSTSFSSAGSHPLSSLNPGTQYNIRVDGATGGSATTIFTEAKATKPEAPTFIDPVTSDIAERSITVRWSPPAGGADTYELTWELSDLGPQSAQTHTGLTSTSFTIDDLAPGEDYSFTLAAVKFGEKSADALLDTNTKPFPPLIDETNAGSTSSIIVKWAPASESEQTSYTVTYQQGNIANQQTACQQTVQMQCTIIIDVATYEPGTGFVVRVFANKGAWSSSAATATANTKPLPPENLVRLSATDTSISLQWSVPSGTVMTSFTVTVDPAEGISLDPSSSGSVYTYTVNDLASGKLYTFRVFTVSGDEISEERTLLAHTIPPQPIAPNRVSATTDSITVAWSEPSGGNFEKYRLTITRNGAVTQIEVNKASQKEAVFTTLFPGGSYVVTIVTVVGTNPEVVSTASQASFRIKPLPATNLRINSFTEASLIAVWNPPNPAQSDFTRYEASIQGSSDEPVRLSAGSTLSAPFSGLQPGTLYTVELVTYSEDQPSETISVDHYTKPNAPRNLRQGAVTTNTISVQWNEPEAASANFEYQIIIVEVGAPSNTEKKSILSSSTQTHTFDTGVVPAVEYDIKLVSRVGSGVRLVQSNEATIRLPTLSTPVQLLRVSSRSTTTLSCAWNPPTGVTPDSYKVSIKKEGEQNVIQETTTSAATYQRSGLTAGATYELTVKPIKFNVEGEPSVLSATLTPDPVASISQKYVGNINVEIEWVPPATSTGYDGFEITVLKKSDNSQVTSVSASRGETTAEIGGLEPGVTYKIQIIVSSNNQFSEAREIQITTSPEGVTSVELASSTDVTLSITWAAPNVAGLDGYDVSILPNDPNLILPVRVQTKAYTFSGLVPGKIYTVSLTVVVTTGASSSAVTRQLQTKPSAVENLSSSDITENSITITWSRKQESLQDKFQIIYKKTGEDGNTNPVEVTATASLSYQHVIRSLESGYSYEIEVTAFRNAVGSTKKFKTFTTVPGRVTNVQAIAPGSTSIAVTWIADPDSFQTGFKVSYKVLPDGETGSKTAAASATSESFTGLFPGERYRVTVEAISGSKTSSAETQEVVTRPLGPTNVHEDPTRTTTSGFRIVWEYDTSKSRVTQWMLRHAVVGEGWTEIPETEPSKRDAFFNVNLSDAGKTFNVEIIANSYGASSTVIGQIQVTLKPQMTSLLIENTEETSTDIITLTYTTSSSVFDEYVFTVTNSPATNPVLKAKNDQLRTVTFNDLVAGTAYTIEAVTRSGSQTSDPASIVIHTVPNQPEVTLNQADTSITVIIERPAGEVSFYEIRCYGQSCPGPLNVEDNSAQVQRTIQPLRPFTTYRFEVTAVVTAPGGNKVSTTATKVAVTEQGPPGPVTDLREVSVLPYEVTLAWGEPLARNGELTGYTVSYQATKDNSQPLTMDPVDLFPDETRFRFQGLTAGYTYVFEVRARTSAGVGDSQQSTVTTPIKPPELGIGEAKAKATVMSAQSDSITCTFVDPFTQRNGRITAYTVVVTTEPTDPFIKSNQIISTWKEAQLVKKKSWMAIAPCATFFTDMSACYRTNGRRKRDLNDVTDFTVGSESCESSPPDSFCNGPLESSTEYYFALRALTEDGQFTDAPFSDPFKTDSGTNWLVVGLIIALVILLVIFIVVVVFILYKRGHICNSRLNRKKSERPYVPQTRLTPIVRNASHRKSGVVDTSRPIKIAVFPDHVVAMAKDTDFKFSEEFEDLKHVGREQPTVAADLPVNRNKNRFTNILPYDATRVKLLPTDDEEGSDYINANYVPGFNSKREFIVCQGPLPSTRDDFWRMTWEQNCRAIVMLTKCVEKGREKCDHYWPVDSEPMFYGDLQVTILNETRCAEWVTTEFKVAKGEQFRKIKHFHFTAWPDFGTPEKPQSLIRFVRLVRAKVGPEGGPVIVHCSAGVGRSGTFCALDRILYDMEDGAESVDIYGIVYEMRHHRVWMVQTEQQYICIHQCLLCVLEGREDDISPYQGEDNEAFDDDEGITMESN